MVRLREAASYGEWFDAISSCGEENPLYTLTPWFAAQLPADPPITAVHTMAVLRTVERRWREGGGGGGGWAPTSAEELRRNVVWMREQHFLPEEHDA